MVYTEPEQKPKPIPKPKLLYKKISGDLTMSGICIMVSYPLYTLPYRVYALTVGYFMPAEFNQYNNRYMTLNELVALWFEGKITDSELDTLSNNIK